MLVQETKSPSERFQPRGPDARTVRIGQTRQEGVVPELGVESLDTGRDVQEGVPKRVRSKGPGEEARGGVGGGRPMGNFWKLLSGSFSLLFEGREGTCKRW